MQIKQIINAVVDELYPQQFKFVFCASEVFENASICSACKHALPLNSGKVCLRCGTPMHTLAKYCYHCKELPFAFKSARSPFVYDGVVRDAIRQLKYQNAKYVALPLAQQMANCYLAEGFDCDLVISVPLHSKREKERGYNQAQLLAAPLAQALGLPLVSDVLIRRHETPSQTLLNRKERERNLKSAFKANKKSKVLGKTVLLVDDVFTTGATMDSCSEVLVKAGAKQVFCLTVAHTDFSNKTKG